MERHSKRCASSTRSVFFFTGWTPLKPKFRSRSKDLFGSLNLSSEDSEAEITFCRRLTIFEWYAVGWARGFILNRQENSVSQVGRAALKGCFGCENVSFLPKLWGGIVFLPISFLDVSAKQQACGVKWWEMGPDLLQAWTYTRTCVYMEGEYDWDTMRKLPPWWWFLSTVIVWQTQAFYSACVSILNSQGQQFLGKWTGRHSKIPSTVVHIVLYIRSSLQKVRCHFNFAFPVGHDNEEFTWETTSPNPFLQRTSKDDQRERVKRALEAVCVCVDVCSASCLTCSLCLTDWKIDMPPPKAF